MVWRRRSPTRRNLPAPVRTGAKIEAASANQNPANEWQQWLRAGVLVKAKVNIFATSRQQDGITMAFGDNWRPNADAVLLKGELAICLGELSRRKVPDSFSRQTKAVVTAWYFLFPSGMFVADPSFFEEGAPDLEE